MNANRIFAEGFSNPDTRRHYQDKAPIDGRIQCGGCSFYAVFNADWGLCCHRKSGYYLETASEHFGCDQHIPESWESHSFQEEPRMLVDRACLIRLLRRCAGAIEGKRGMGVVSRDVRLLGLEITDPLVRYETTE